MLENARRSILPASSNLPLRSTDDWVHLLPSLELPLVWVCGELAETTRARIEAIAAEARSISVGGPPEAAANTPDLVVFAAWDRATRIAAADWLPGALGANAVIVVLRRAGRVVGMLELRLALRRLTGLLGDGAGWLAVPEGRRPSQLARRGRTVRRMVEARLAGLVGRTSKRARAHASDLSTVGVEKLRRRPSAGTGAIIVGRGIGRWLPAYLASFVDAHLGTGAGSNWSYSPSRGFASQKVVFRVGRADGAGDVLIKSTQEERFNQRLANEVAALRGLEHVDLSDEIRVPRVMFADLYGGLLHAAETLEAGEPLRSVADPAPHGAHYRRATDTIAALGAATHATPEPGQLAIAMSCVVAQFCEIYDPPADVRARLERSSVRLGASNIPSVFHHGDFTMWNLLWDPKGRLVVLDWENADPAGMPLWDLFVFTRTFGVYMADVAGRRYNADIFAGQLLAPSPLHRQLRDAVDRYRRSVPVPADAVGDLFTMCWVHEAVKEAATLPQPNWRAGRNTRYLERVLHAPGWTS